MLTISVLFVGLTLATAVIAYWSDNLGKKLGKKRVSLWSMRPRTTATFLTIASSWLIMVFTLGVMLTIFPLLRQSLLHYDEVRGQKLTLDGQVKALKAQFHTASDDLGEVTAELKKSSEAAKSARQDQKAAERDAAVAQKSADAFRKREQAAIKREQDARKNLTTVTKQRDATEKQRQAAQRELKAAQTEVKSASLQVKAADARVQKAQTKVTQAEANVTQAQAKLGAVQASLGAVQASLGAVQASLGTALQNETIAKASADTAQARADEAIRQRKQADKDSIKAFGASEKAKAEVTAAQEKVEQLEKQRQTLIDENKLLSDDNEAIGLQRNIILASDIRVPVGRTLVARSFEPGVSFSDATEKLHALFDLASKLMPGFLPGARLQLASRVVPAPSVNKDDEKVLVLVKEDEIYNGLAETISRSQTPLSVRLIADRNHLEGQDTLYSRFIIVPVRPAIAVNTELASATFSQTIGDAKLFSALLKLVEAGREIAVQNDVTPPLSPAAPDFYVPGSNEKIFEALRKVSALDGRARVSIVTDKAISTIDQLSVRFDVEPLAPTTAAASNRKSPA